MGCWGGVQLVHSRLQPNLILSDLHMMLQSQAVTSWWQPAGVTLAGIFYLSASIPQAALWCSAPTLEEVTSLGIFLSGGQMCLGFSKGTEISTAERETAAPENRREMGFCVVWRSLATLRAAADPERRRLLGGGPRGEIRFRLACREATVWWRHRDSWLGSQKHRDTRERDPTRNINAEHFWQLWEGRV